MKRDDELCYFSLLSLDCDEGWVASCSPSEIKMINSTSHKMWLLSFYFLSHLGRSFGFAGWRGVQREQVGRVERQTTSNGEKGMT